MEQKTNKDFHTFGRAVLTWLFTILLGSIGMMVELAYIGELSDINMFTGLIMVIFFSGLFTLPTLPVLWLIYAGLKNIIYQKETAWFYLFIATGLLNFGVVFFLSQIENMGNDIWGLLPYVIVSFIVVIRLNRKILFGLPVMQEENSL